MTILSASNRPVTIRQRGKDYVLLWGCTELGTFPSFFEALREAADIYLAR